MCRRFVVKFFFWIKQRKREALVLLYILDLKTRVTHTLFRVFVCTVKETTILSRRARARAREQRHQSHLFPPSTKIEHKDFPVKFFWTPVLSHLYLCIQFISRKKEEHFVTELCCIPTAQNPLWVFVKVVLVDVMIPRGGVPSSSRPVVVVFPSSSSSSSSGFVVSASKKGPRRDDQRRKIVVARCHQKSRFVDVLFEKKKKKKRNDDARVAASSPDSSPSSSGGGSWEEGKKSGANNKAIINPDAYKVLSVIRKRAGDYVDTKRVVGVPSSVFHMAERHFVAELKALFREHVLDKKDILAKEEERTALTEFSLSKTFDASATFDEENEFDDKDALGQGEVLLEYLEQLKLSNDKIWEREKYLPKVHSPWIIDWPYKLLCVILDLWFPENRPIQRFWLLETVARMPYFSYNSMLTLYEILGWWRKSSDLRKVHFAEEWNEYQHLLVMESLGGDRKWSDRFLGQHAALVYYLGLIIIWLISPKLAYNFSERIETHAVATYAQFTEENRALLESLPAPDVAKAYYEGDDLYLFDEFQTTTLSSTGEVMSLKLEKDATIENAYMDRKHVSVRRPKIETLYDVFINICEDEKEHVGTMNACQIDGVTLGTANTINALTALALGGSAATRIASRLAEDSDIVGGLDGIVGKDLLTALTDLFSAFDLPFF